MYSSPGRSMRAHRLPAGNDTPTTSGHGISLYPNRFRTDSPASPQSAFFATISPFQLVACPGVSQSPTVWHFQGNPDQKAESIACGYLDTLSQVV
jgi:hypothetical protein